MYSVRSVHVNLSLQLQNGGVTIPKGATVDLEQFCTYTWLTADTTLQRLITAGYLTVVTDSRTTYYSGPNASVPDIVSSFFPVSLNPWKTQPRLNVQKPLEDARGIYRGGLGPTTWNATILGANGVI